MKIGMIGLGDIARKAYLPVLMNRSDIEVHLMGRTPEKLKVIADAHRVTKRFTSIQGLISAGIQAAFVHSSTESHYEIVKLLLTNGVHVFVDKPIDENIRRTKELVALADAQQLSLMVGFNRRYARAYQKVFDVVHPQIVIMQKNRINSRGNVRTLIYDDFIHVVDTLRFFLNGHVTDLDANWEEENGFLSYVMVRLTGGGKHAIGVMHRHCGTNEEILEVLSQGVKYTVRNVREIVKCSDTIELIEPNSWSETYVERGFQPMVDRFIDAVRDGETLSAQDALETHVVCEKIIELVLGQWVDTPNR